MEHSIVTDTLIYDSIPPFAYVFKENSNGRRGPAILLATSVGI
jgi:hypothetical protein